MWLPYKLYVFLPYSGVLLGDFDGALTEQLSYGVDREAVFDVDIADAGAAESCEVAS